MWGEGVTDGRRWEMFFWLAKTGSMKEFKRLEDLEMFEIMGIRDALSSMLL